MQRGIKMVKAKCGCIIPKTKSLKNTCSKCKQIFCDKHIYFYIDGNNIAITKNSKPYCFDCYKEIYQ